jgi:nucleoside-diphosphate-sugar epimerase
MEKILITGGAGYVGSLLAKRLLQRGYKVRVLDQLIFGKEPLHSIANDPDFDLQIGLVEDNYMLSKCLDGIDAVIHLAGLSNDPCCELNSDLTQKANVDATKVLLQLSEKKGVKRIIYASSCSVYGFTENRVVDEQSPVNPLTAYARSKTACEDLVLNGVHKDLVTVCLRKSTLYGPSPRMRFDLVINTMTGMAISDGRIIINGGEQWRPFLHVEDAVDVHLFMLTADAQKINRQVFNVGSNDQNVKIADLAKNVARCVPDVEISISDSPDHRSYRVNFDKINGIGWKTKFTIDDGIRGIKEMFDTGEIKDFRDLNYFNIKRMLSYLNI